MDIPTDNKESIKSLLEENRQYLKAIYRQVEKTRRYIFWGRIISLLYLLIIIAPVILAIVYLPPLLKDLIGPYQDLLGTGSSRGELNSDIFTQFQGLIDSGQ